MVALVVMLIAALGLLGLHRTSLGWNLEARRMTRAATIAQDLLNQIETWSYTDPRLSNPKTANDADISDDALKFEASADPKTAGLADHDEDDLGGSWSGMVAVQPYQRFWNVATPDDSNGNGTADGKRIAVIVRWPHGSGWRRIVLHGMVNDPAEGQ